MKDAVFCFNIMLKLGFDQSFGSVPHQQHVGVARRQQPHLQSTRKAHRAEVFFVQELVEEGRVAIHYVKSEDADLGTKRLDQHRHRNLIKLTNEVKA